MPDIGQLRVHRCIEILMPTMDGNNLRGGGGRGCVQGAGGREDEGEEERDLISDEIQETVIDRVLAHGMTTREAGQRGQPDGSRFSVTTRTFRKIVSVYF